MTEERHAENYAPQILQRNDGIPSDVAKQTEQSVQPQSLAQKRRQIFAPVFHMSPPSDTSSLSAGQCPPLPNSHSCAPTDKPYKPDLPLVGNLCPAATRLDTIRTRFRHVLDVLLMIRQYCKRN